MGVIELVLIGVVGLILWLLRNVWRNYTVVGLLLDIIGMPGVQERLTNRKANYEFLERTANQYVFLTRYVPLMVVGIFVLIGTLYVTASSGTGLSPALAAVGGLTIAGVITWLINFESVPPWLHEWHLTVLLTKSAIDLEAVTASLESYEQRLNAGEFDDLTETELEYVNLQVVMLETIASNVLNMIKDLEQQQMDLRV